MYFAMTVPDAGTSGLVMALLLCVLENVFGGSIPTRAAINLQVGPFDIEVVWVANGACEIAVRLQSSIYDYTAIAEFRGEFPLTIATLSSYKEYTHKRNRLFPSRTGVATPAVPVGAATFYQVFHKKAGRHNGELRVRLESGTNVSAANFVVRQFRM